MTVLNDPVVEEVVPAKEPVVFASKIEIVVSRVVKV